MFLAQTHEIVPRHCFRSLLEVTWYDVTMTVILVRFCTAQLWPKCTISNHSSTIFQNSQE